MHARGNALFLILIAVALFAALSYAVTRSGRGGSGMGKEKLSLEASQIIQYSQSVYTAVQRMQLIGGIETKDLEFSASELAGPYDNPNCNDTSCQVFHPDGGGVIYKDPPAQWLIKGANQPWYFMPRNAIQGVGTTCAADSCADLVMVFHTIPKELCMEINNVLGIANLADEPPTDSDTTMANFTGTFTWQFTIGDEADSSALAGRYAGCFLENDGTPAYHYYQVLVAR